MPRQKNYELKEEDEETNTCGFSSKQIIIFLALFLFVGLLGAAGVAYGFYNGVHNRFTEVVAGASRTLLTSWNLKTLGTLVIGPDGLNVLSALNELTASIAAGLSARGTLNFRQGTGTLNSTGMITIVDTLITNVTKIYVNSQPGGVNPTGFVYPYIVTNGVGLTIRSSAGASDSGVYVSYLAVKEIT